MKSACFSFINLANEPASAGTYARRCTCCNIAILIAQQVQSLTPRPGVCHALCPRLGWPLWRDAEPLSPIRDRYRISREQIGVPAHRHEPGGGGAGGASDYRVARNSELCDLRPSARTQHCTSAQTRVQVAETRRHLCPARRSAETAWKGTGTDSCSVAPQPTAGNNFLSTHVRMRPPLRDEGMTACRARRWRARGQTRSCVQHSLRVQ